MSIAKKIFAITFLISCVAIAGISGLTLTVASDFLRDLARKRLSETVQREARLVKVRFDMIRSEMMFLVHDNVAGIVVRLRWPETPGQSPPSSNDLEQAQRQLLSHFSSVLQKQSSFRDIRFVYRDGDVLRSLYGMRSRDMVVVGASMVSERDFIAPFFAETARIWPGNLHVSPIRQERNGDGLRTQSIYLGIPIGGSPQGIAPAAIVAVLDVDDFLGGLGQADTDIHLAVTDRRGAYIFFGDPVRQQALAAGEGGNLKDDHDLGQEWSSWSKRNDLFMQIEAPRHSMVLALHRVPLSDPPAAGGAEHLVVSGLAPSAMFEMEVMHFRSYLGVLVVGIGVAMALALALATRYLTQPILALTRATDRIAAGDREVVIPSAPRDEIGALTEAIRRMLAGLRQAAKVEEQAILGRMASMVAHDLRNALSSIKMNLQMLENDYGSRNRDAYECRRLALGQVAYMENILRDMLDFARPDNLLPDWLDIDNVLKTAVVSLLPEATAKGVDISGLDVRRLPRLLGDRTKLIQAFQNLFSNAIDAVAEGGRITLDARSLLYDSRPAVEVTIADDGEGIAPEMAKKLFEPFFTTRAKGTGLGLSIVQRIIRQHGGQVQLMANPTGGTIAVVTLLLVPPGLEKGYSELAGA